MDLRKKKVMLEKMDEKKTRASRVFLQLNKQKKADRLASLTNLDGSSRCHNRCAFLALTKCLVGGEEFESPTPWMSTKYSNQLN